MSCGPHRCFQIFVGYLDHNPVHGVVDSGLQILLDFFYLCQEFTVVSFPAGECGIGNKTYCLVFQCLFGKFVDGIRRDNPHHEIARVFKFISQVFLKIG